MRFGKPERAILLPRHWLITRNPIYGNHTEGFLTSLKMQSRWSLNRQYIDKCTYELYRRGYVCAHIRFLTIHCYVYPLNMSPYGITALRSIPFEVLAPISFYEKTCGKGSNIIEAISISDVARDVCSFSLGDQRRNKYAVISNFSNNPTEFSKNHLFPICAAVYSPWCKPRTQFPRSIRFISAITFGLL